MTRKEKRAPLPARERLLALEEKAPGPACSPVTSRRLRDYCQALLNTIISASFVPFQPRFVLSSQGLCP